MGGDIPFIRPAELDIDGNGAITDSPNPRKYWSVLKTRLKKAGNELTTRCSQLKMTAADGKRYAKKNS